MIGELYHVNKNSGSLVGSSMTDLNPYELSQVLLTQNFNMEGDL